MTLFFGFLPNSNIQVIGVGWTLGVIFAFYIIFPFFVYLFWTKRRAWFVFVISLVLNYACAHYFLADGNAVGCNIARWMCYFLVGGLIYLYRDLIERFLGKNLVIRILALLVVIGLTVAWFFVPGTVGGVDISTIKAMLMFVSWLCYAISVKSVILANPVTKFISSISFEVYLAHMLVFRVVERLGLLHLAGTGWSAYFITSLIVLVGVGVFAWAAKWAIDKAIKGIFKWNENRKRKKLLEDASEV